MLHPAYLSAYNVPYETWLQKSLLPQIAPGHQDTSHVAIGALIFKYAQGDEPDRILLIRRATTDSMPNRWEIPGGACDLEDETIFHSLAREVHEETGLTVTKVVDFVDGSSYVTRSTTEGKGGEWDSLYLQDEATKGYAELANPHEEDVQVTLDPNEHSAYAWATNEEVLGEKHEITAESQRRIILKGFQMLEAK
ncbi:hypothetical protein EJ08DRAFT_598096 [Tothia fuscella]|uniref:Nudix hydrolase domain-containing protein n=1 Tax=Tothia fuscella TaxID=1048955 RepID=A0A9P4NGI3_9PEZI|nr:hypothetical protein EJ08DRAFT_598096 [Tothia fuscella]